MAKKKAARKPKTKAERLQAAADRFGVSIEYAATDGGVLKSQRLKPADCTAEVIRKAHKIDRDIDARAKELVLYTLNGSWNNERRKLTRKERARLRQGSVRSDNIS